MDLSAAKRCKTSVLKKVEVIERLPSNGLINGSLLNHSFTELCASHYLKQCKSFLPTLARDEMVGFDHLLRGTIVIMSSLMQEEHSPLNDQVKRLMDTFFESGCLRSEVLAEFLLLLMGHNRLKEAKEEFSNHWNRHEILYITVDELEKIAMGSVVVLDYMECIKNLNSSDNLYQSQEELGMILDQTLTSMTSVVKRSAGPYDFLIPRILDILVHKKLIDDAFDCLISYKKANNDNLNAYVYLYKFLVHQDEYNTNFQRTINECFNKIVEFSPSSPLILEILDYCEVEACQVCEVLMEFIDYTSNKNNAKAWGRLFDYLEKLDIVSLERVLKHYKLIYSSYWHVYHWDNLGSEQINRDLNFWKNKVRSILNQQL